MPLMDESVAATPGEIALLPMQKPWKEVHQPNQSNSRGIEAWRHSRVVSFRFPRPQVKCDRLMPCKRCVRLHLVCRPQERKRGRPLNSSSARVAAARAQAQAQVMMVMMMMVMMMGP
jgi:hypothetical protein